MTDLILQAAPVVSHIKHAAHVAHAAVPPVTLGVSMITTAIASAVSLVAGYGIRWYFSGGSATVSAVSSEMTTIKNDITALKAKVGI